MTQVQHQLKVVNILHGIQFVLGAAVLGIGLYLMFFASPRPQGNSGRWALSVVSVAKHTLVRKYQSRLNSAGGQITRYHRLPGAHNERQKPAAMEQRQSIPYTRRS